MDSRYYKNPQFVCHMLAFGMFCLVNKDFERNIRVNTLFSYYPLVGQRNA